MIFYTPERNSLSEAAKVCGAIVITGMFVGAVCIGAWGFLTFMAIGTPAIGWLERKLRPDLYR